MTVNNRDLDLVLWGATGFTGELAAACLARHPDSSSLQWALGGRDRRRLEALRDRVAPNGVPLFIGDAHDSASMLELAARARVICSVVGPYAVHGSQLVAACAASGTHYCDLSGELPWIRRMIDAHHDEARRSGACIVHCCGFDSVPSDMGAFLAQIQTRAETGRSSPNIKSGVVSLSAGLSRGTLLSLINAFDEAASSRTVRKLVRDAYALSPHSDHERPSSQDRLLPRFDPDFECWTAPFIMAGINTRVVRRSSALQSELYPKEFVYEECILLGDRIRDLARAAGISAATIIGIAALFVAPVRRRVARKIGTADAGPVVGSLANGSWDLKFRAAPPSGSNHEAMFFRMRANEDPGYKSTARLLTECALCLSLDPIERTGGFHTPSSAMGGALLRRIQSNAGITIVRE